jgi:hypothetical protein
MKKLMILLGMLGLIILQASFAQSNLQQPEDAIADLKAGRAVIGTVESEWLTETLSPKFRTEPALYTSAYNPASLGFIDRDTFFFWVVQLFPAPAEVDAHGGTQLLDGYYVDEKNQPWKYGYMMPLGESLGLGVEYITTSYHRMLYTPFTFNNPEGMPDWSIGSNQILDGGVVSLGYRFRENMSVGASAAVWYTGEGEEAWEWMYETGLGFSVLGAYMLLIPDRDLALSFSAAYAYAKQWYLDIAAQKLEEGAPPLVLEAALASSLMDGRLYLNAAAITDIYIDGRGGHVVRAIPAAEYSLARFFSVRAGGELSYMLQDGDFAFGYGGLAGVSFKFWRIELNVNFTIREKPARTLPGQSLQDWSLSGGLRFIPGLFRR